MNPTQYPSLADVIAIHGSAIVDALERQPKPLRDEGIAGVRADGSQMAAYYDGADIVRQAALLGTASRKHKPFSTGTSGLPICARYVSPCQWLEFVGDRLELARQFEQFAERSNELDATIDAFEAWLRHMSSPAPSAISFQRRSSMVRTILRRHRAAGCCSPTAALAIPDTYLRAHAI